MPQVYLYGLTLYNSKLNFDDLTQAFNSDGSIIAHLKNNHFVIVTNISSDGKVTYTEINKGKDGHSYTVSKKDFQDAWTGYAITKSAPRDQKKILSAEKAQRVKGSCLPFLFFLIAAFIQGAVTIAAGVVAGIAAVVMAVSAVIAPIISAIGSFIVGITNLLAGVVAQIFTAIQFVGVSLLHGIGAFFGGTLFAGSAAAIGGSSTGFTLAGLGMAIGKTVVLTALSFAISKGLDALGVNPIAANLISSFITGGVSGLFSGGFTALSFIAGGLQGLAVQGVSILGQRLGLDPSLSSIIGLAAGSLIGAALNGAEVPMYDSVTHKIVGTYLATGLDAISYSMGATILPNVAGELAYYGVGKIGELLGVDPRISYLAGIGIRSSLQAGFNGGSPADIWGSVMMGVAQGALNIGIEYTGQKLKIDPMYTALAARAISGALEGLVTPVDPNDPNSDRKGLLRGAIEGLFDSGRNFLVLGGTATGSDPWSQAAYIAQVLDISRSIQEKGLAETLQTYATGILQEDSISAIMRTGMTISEYINQKRSTGSTETVTASDGKEAELIELGDAGTNPAGDAGNYIIERKDESGKDDLLAVQDGNSYREADIGPDGKADWTHYTEVMQHWDGSVSISRVENGQIVSSDIYTIDGGSYTAYSANGYNLIPNKSFSPTVLENGVVKDNLTGDETYFKDGVKVKDKFVTGSFTLQQDTQGNVHIYALRDSVGNGAGYVEISYDAAGNIVGGNYQANPNLLNTTVEITDPLEKAKIIQDANRLIQPDNPNPPDNHLNMGMGVAGSQFYEGMVQIGAIVPGVGSSGVIGGADALILTGSYYDSAGVKVPIVIKGSKQNNEDDPWWKQQWNNWFGKSDSAKPKYVYDARVGRYRSTETGRFVSADNLPWPEFNAGFEYSTKTTLQAGKVFDRYGRPTGRYGAEIGTTISERGIPPGSERSEYHRYEVVKPVQVDAGPSKAVLEFNAKGGGTQYYFGKSINDLIADGTLREIR